MKVKSQLKPHSFDPGDNTFINGFLATLKLTRHTDRIHEEAAI